MKFLIPMSRETVIDLFEKAVDDWGLRDAITMRTNEDRLTLTIRRMGVSTLTLRNTTTDSHTIFELVDENLAFTHRPLRGKILSKLTDIVAEYGGSML